MVPALLIAVALHAVLLALPVSLQRDSPSRPAPIHITLKQSPEPPVAPAAEEPARQPAAPELPAKSEPPSTTAKPTDTAPQPKETAPAKEKSDPADATRTNTTNIPRAPATTETGAKSRSTVFDPRLAEKLERERNKVQKFESGDAEYRTTTGTFVQQGDRCWEVKQLIPGDTSVESSQWLRTKCPRASRSRSDMDRLARKYGIP